MELTPEGAKPDEPAKPAPKRRDLKINWLEGEGEPQGKPLVILETSPDAIKKRRELNTKVAQLEAELRKLQDGQQDQKDAQKTMAELDAQAAAAAAEEAGDPFGRDERTHRAPGARKPPPRKTPRIADVGAGAGAEGAECDEDLDGEDDQELDEEGEDLDGEDDEGLEEGEEEQEGGGTSRASAAPGTGPLPLKLFEDKGQAVGPTYLKGILKDLWRSYEFENVRAPPKHILGWYVAPGVPFGSAKQRKANADRTLPISVKAEFLQGSYKHGTYFIRHRPKGEDGPKDVFYVCKVDKHPDDADKPHKGSKAMEGNAILLRGMEELRVQNRELTQALTQERKENDKLREDLRDTRDELAEERRTVKARDAEIDDLRERGEPLMDKDVADDLGVKLILAGEEWLSKPSGKMKEYVDRLLALNRELYESQKALLERLGEFPMLRQFLEQLGEPYDGSVAAMNRVAKLTGQEDNFHDSGAVLKMLGPHEIDTSDDAILEEGMKAQKELVAAEEKVVKLKAKIGRLEEEKAEVVAMLAETVDALEKSEAARVALQAEAEARAEAARAEAQKKAKGEKAAQAAAEKGPAKPRQEARGKPRAMATPRARAAPPAKRQPAKRHASATAKRNPPGKGTGKPQADRGATPRGARPKRPVPKPRPKAKGPVPARRSAPTGPAKRRRAPARRAARG